MRRERACFAPAGWAGRKGGAEDSTAARLAANRSRSGYYVQMRRSARARTAWLSRLSRHAWPLWLVTAALVVGLMPMHSGLEQHGALDGPTRVWLTICPPGPARHLEPSASVELPRCNACALQMQTIGAALPALRRPVGLVLVGHAVAALHELPAAPLLRLPASRGPPLA